MGKNYSIDVGFLTVSELIALLQSISEKCDDWPVYCCGSGEFFLCVNEQEECVVIDEEDVFDELDEDEDVYCL